MVGVLRRERHEPAAVEADAVVVHEVRILARVHPAGAEPDLPLVFVHLLDAAHHPFAPRDLVLHLSGDAVVQIEMVPAVALRHPDHFLAVGDVVAVLLARVALASVGRAVVEEGLRLLGDDGARRAGRRIHLDDTVDLMAALVVLERERMAVLPPHRARQLVGIQKQRVRNRDRGFRVDVDHHGLRQIQDVARLRVDARGVFRLQLILGRRLDVVHFALVPRTHAGRGDFS